MLLLTGIFCGSQVPRVVFVWGQCWYWDQFIWNLWAKKHYWWSGYTTSRADAFESGNTGCRVFKLERFLPKNQQSQRKLLNFENLCNGKLSKIGQHFSNLVIKKVMLSKNVNNQKSAPKLVFFNEKKWERFKWFLT